jgi:hypothetical protein
MKIRAGGNAVAIALAGLAVVLAATGTAYSVTASAVKIADPTTPTRIAHVDGAGRLTTVGATSNIDTITNFGFDATQAVTSPTTATFAITSVGWSNPGLNSAYPGTTYNVNLVKIHAGTTSQCVVGQDGAYVERYLGGRLLDPGDDTEITYPEPLLVKPTASAEYCLGILTSHLGGAQSTLYLSTFQLTAYTYGGVYTGVGLGAPSRVSPPTTKRVTR